MYSPLVNPAPHAQGKADESGWPRWAAIQCRSAYLGLGPKENIRNSKSFWKLVWVVNPALPDLRSIWYRDIKRCKEAWSQLAAIWTSRTADTPDTIALRSDSQTWSFRLASRLLWWIRLCHRCFVTCVRWENDAAKIHCQIYRSKRMASARTSWTPGYLSKTASASGLLGADDLSIIFSTVICTYIGNLCGVFAGCAHSMSGLPCLN